MTNNTINQTLQIISIQHELSMSIGLDIHLEPMLYTFMERIKPRLSLMSVAVIYESVSNSPIPNTITSNCLSFPKHTYELDKVTILELAQTLYEENSAPLKKIKLNQLQYYFYIIPDFGVLVLERKHQLINDKVLEAIKPLMKKLSISCLACVQHESLILEIHSRNKAEELITYQSLHDPLTGLANRKYFNSLLECRVANALKNHKQGAIFILDLDRFKVINDSLGHGVGDLLLKAISQRLTERFDGTEVIARIGGDEFAILVDDFHSNTQVIRNKTTQLAQELNRLFSTPFYVDKHLIRATVSIGIQLYPIKGISLSDADIHKSTLINNADLAMYAVKRQSRDGFQFYNKSLHAVSEQRNKIESALRYAIQESEFQMYFQPIVDENGLIVGAEALIRWESKELGWVSPAEFIPIAEESGYIVEIGNWVLHQVCTLYSKIHHQHLNENFRYISINVSPRQFSSLFFESYLLETLQKYNVPHKHIRIEITEGIALENVDIALSRMKRLKDKGYAFMLDDFGTGYSSLSYIHQLPLNTVKIDRGFITNIHSNTNNQVIVNAIIDICTHFKLECVVEGVESDAEVDYLRSKGVTRFQGYYFYRPQPANDLLENISK